MDQQTNRPGAWPYESRPNILYHSRGLLPPWKIYLNKGNQELSDIKQIIQCFKHCTKTVNMRK